MRLVLALQPIDYRTMEAKLAINDDEEVVQMKATKRDRTAAILVASGKKLRDEFVCPITRDLMRYPVLASDGFTYDKDAVEGWLKKHDTSPMTGEKMGRSLIPNHNLRKLILDLMNEGGEGLYVSETGSGESCGVALVREKVLVLSCMGPSESTWNGRRFRVRQNGTIGGRKTPDNLLGHSFMSFSDNTVSRSHFLVTFNKEEKSFFITDLGSAGGTFFRVAFGDAAPVGPGSMIMFGKHQLEAFDPRHTAPNEVYTTVNAKVDDEAMADVVGSTSRTSPMAKNEDDEAPEDKGSRHSSMTMASKKDDGRASPSSDFGEAKAAAKEVRQDVDVPPDAILGLRCFAPEGSPLQERMFYVGSEGATVGRKQSNHISFSRTVDDTVLGIDNSISGEHGRLEYVQDSEFLLRDGVGNKPSTNGSWIRLSKPGQRSSAKALRTGMEVLIGTVRFLASLEEEVIQKEFDEMDTSELEELQNQARRAHGGLRT